MHPQRYDGGTPIRTRLEKGPVEVVNLIANRARFDIDLRVGKAGAEVFCRPGRHVVYAPIGTAHVKVDGRAYTSLRITHCACALMQGQMSRYRPAKSSLAPCTTRVKRR